MAQDEQSPLDDLIRDLTLEISQMQRWIAERAGLNTTDLMSLYFIRHADGRATPKALAEHLGLTSGATTILLNRLDKRGYVVRSAHPSDRRVVLLSLGPAAKSDSFFNLRKHLYSVNSAVIEALSPEEARIVRQFMASMIESTRQALQQLRTADEVARAEET